MPAVNQLPDLFLVNQFAPVCGSQSFLYLSEKPFVIIDEPLDRFLHECLVSRPRSVARRASLACRSGPIFTSIAQA
jgi:hypothetical protein